MNLHAGPFQTSTENVEGAYALEVNHRFLARSFSATCTAIPVCEFWLNFNLL